ncbi:MAG: hypothetical protein HZC55_27410 [Verrucomicrobia bacterium]|nr:hypothetical protein [Verrucomicrobiota bacterium]
MPPRPRVFSARWVVVLVLVMAGARVAHLRASDLVWSRPGEVRELVTEAARFRPFAERVAADVERALAATPAPTGETLARLRALQVHLGLYLGSDARALAAATWIRETVTPPAERSFSGLLTEAIVVARAATAVGSSSAEHQAALGAALAPRLEVLPPTAEIRAVLMRQRDRFRELSRESLLAEADRLGARLDRADHWTLADVDEVARVGHRLATILPVRAVLLAEFDAALVRRGHPGEETRRPTTPAPLPSSPR